MSVNPLPTRGLLGDTAARDYSEKLRRFNAFAAPELRAAIRSLGLRPGMRVLDAGCGAGEALAWLRTEVGTTGTVVGMDLALAHVAAAFGASESPRTRGADGEAQDDGDTDPDKTMCGIVAIQADVLSPPFMGGAFDTIWSVNVINHLRSPLDGVRVLAGLLAPGGTLALGQSSFLPDMCFAWDARLERVVNEAVRTYYRDKYAIDERGLSAVRANVGLLRDAGLQHVTARTFAIDRISPVDADATRYIVETLFRDSWGARLAPYLSADDYEALRDLCDPASPRFALARPDFHFLQTFTLVTGKTLL